MGEERHFESRRGGDQIKGDSGLRGGLFRSVELNIMRKGLTYELYWFSRDTGASACTGSRADTLIYDVRSVLREEERTYTPTKYGFQVRARGIRYRRQNTELLLHSCLA